MDVPNKITKNNTIVRNAQAEAMSGNGVENRLASMEKSMNSFFGHYKNKPKEDDHKVLGDRSNKKTEPDCYLLCRKQRNYEGSTDGEPSIGLWRHRDAGNFVENAGEPAQFFQNYPHYQTR